MSRFASRFAALACALVLLCATGCRSSGSPQPANAAADFANTLRNKVTTDAMMKHLSKLQDIANANKGTRAVDTPGYDASVDYVVGTLRNSGFDVQTPEFSAKVYHAEKGSVTIAGKDFEARDLEFSPGTAPEGVTGPLVAVPVNDSPGCQASDYDGL